MASSQKLGRLVIIKGDADFSITEDGSPTFVYCIDRELPSTTSAKVEVINDHDLLHSYALKIRDEYSKWVYTFNEEFLSHGIKKHDLSLFFLSDFSCKRSELFDTYNSICSLLLIRDKIRDTPIVEASLIGLEASFCRAFSSMFPDIRVSVIQERGEKFGLWRSLTSDLMYLFETAFVGVINLFEMGQLRRSDQFDGRYFFSPYPKHLKPNQTDGPDIKYRRFAKTEDRYLVSILMDGFHQHVGLRRFFKLKKELPSGRFTLLDSYIRPFDVFFGIYWLLIGRIYSMTAKKRQYRFLGIDLTAYVQTELLVSFSRIARLMVMEKQLRRFFNYHKIKEFVYILHEYPIGRLLSYVLGTVPNKPLRIGFQHGPASWIKMLYFLAPGESGSDPPFLNHAPIPDRVLAEDPTSVEIYKHAGYLDVQIMESLYRLDYLDGVRGNRDAQRVLIVPGLHDGQLLLSIMKNFICQNPALLCYFRPHPRANNSYLSLFKYFPNVRISYEPIEELLQNVSKVFVTYSSVGVEAKWLGLDVTIVDIPGKLNESPLLDG